MHTNAQTVIIQYESVYSMSDCICVQCVCVYVYCTSVCLCTCKWGASTGVCEISGMSQREGVCVLGGGGGARGGGVSSKWKCTRLAPSRARSSTG